jgi:hypothetical protein
MDVDLRGRFHDGRAEWVFLKMPSIEVDFNNCDREGRVRLSTIGAILSLNESQVTLRNGLEVKLTSGDFSPLKGIVEYSETEHIWVARFDLNDLRDKEIDSPSEP